MNIKHIVYTLALSAIAMVVINNKVLTSTEMSSSPTQKSSLSEDDRINYRLQENQKKIELKKARIKSGLNDFKSEEQSNDFNVEQNNKNSIDLLGNERELAQQGLDDEISAGVEDLDSQLENFSDEDQEFLQEYIENARKNGVKVEVDKNFNVNVK